VSVPKANERWAAEVGLRCGSPKPAEKQSVYPFKRKLPACNWLAADFDFRSWKRKVLVLPGGERLPRLSLALVYEASRFAGGRHHHQSSHTTANAALSP